MNPFRFLWEWTPPDIWANPPDLILGWQDSLLLWIGNQVSGLVSLTGSLLLSFPTHFLETAQFKQLYSLVTITALVFLPGCMVYRFLRAVMGDRRWAFMDQQDVILFIVRFAALTALILKAPEIFIIFSRLANQMVIVLLGITNVGLLYQPSSLGLELIILALLVTIVFYAIRLIIYYAVRNFHLIILVLTTPFVLVRWVIFGDSSKIETWLNQLIGLIAVQILHAFILVILAHLVGLEPPPDTSGKLTKVWAAMVQIGAMELMLRPQIVLGNIISYQPIDEPTHIKGKFSSLTSKVKQLAGGGKDD